MTILSDDTKRTVLKFKPPLARAFVACLLLTSACAWAWQTTHSAGWLAAAITSLILSGMVLLALRLYRRVLTFDWDDAIVHSHVHHWSPLFKDETERWSFRNLAHWQIRQNGSSWSVGFARKGEAFHEVCFVRSLPEAVRVARLLAGRLPRPLRLATDFDLLECNKSLTFYPVSQTQPAFNLEGTLTVRLPMRRRKIGFKGGTLHRWPFFLFEGILCLAVFAIIAPHAHPVTPSVITLVVCMLFGMAGALCTWIALHDLTGSTRLRVETSQLEIRHITLGFLDCSSIRLPLSQIQLALVARYGPNACLILMTGTRAYHFGIGLSPEALLHDRNNLAQVGHIDHPYQSTAMAV
jgi:hypothetical protein